MQEPSHELREILDQAAGVPSEQRPALLDAACAGDGDLRQQVESLLGALDAGDGFLEDPTLGATPDGDSDAAIGARIGRYHLLERIGEGGMGVVYLAEQLQPVHRRVALKLIKPGLDTRQVIARFQAERQALALMDHPHIAKVLDAGATDAGRPYFVMELVRGVPITEYCDQHQLTPRQRLELFIPVCRAVQHAHQKGIIHRDLKPSNVIVSVADDGKPVPKVIDFGIAKAIAGRRPLSGRTLLTEFRQLVGSPLYMSPEQAEAGAAVAAADVDTRADIYGLGALLYELLTGATPFDKQRLTTAAFAEACRIIREEDPPRPSTRIETLAGDTLGTISSSRQMDARRLVQTIRGELDWIVMKALEKDRTRRYETAGALAQDVERYLANQPLQAGPPSRIYRLKTFARRNKAAIGTASVFLLFLLLGTIVSTRQAIRASRAERQAAGQLEGAIAERLRADEQTAIARAEERNLARHLYVSNMLLAQGAWEEDNVEHFLALLGAQIPKPGQRTPDLRGFEWYYWQRVAHGELLAMKWQVPEFGAGACFSPDGTRVACGSDAGVRCWDARTGQTLFTLNGNSRSISFSPDGHRLASAEKNLVEVWDLDTRRVLFTLAADDAEIRMVRYSPDGRLLATAGDDANVRLFDVAARGQSRTLPGRVETLAFSPDSRLLASGSQGGSIILWDLASGQPLRTLQDPCWVFGLCFSPDGHKLASSSADRTVKLWDPATGEQLAAFKNVKLCRSVCFSPDGARLLTTDDNDEVRVWDIATGRVIATHRGHSRALRTASFSPDGTRILSAGYDEIRIWDATAAPPPMVLTATDVPSHEANYLCFDPDGGRLFAPAGERAVKVWDAHTGRELLAIDSARYGAATRVCISSDGQTLASAHPGSGTVNLWNAMTGEQQGMIQTSSVASITFTPDGRTLVTGSWRGDIELWEVATGKQRGTLTGHKDDGRGAAAVNDVRVSPDGARLASAGDDGNVILWDLPAGRPIRTLPGPGSYAYAVCFSHDGRRLAAASYTGRINVWDVASGRQLHTLQGHTDGIHGLTFSPDDRRIASAGLDKTVRLWDCTTGKETLVLKGHTDAVDGVCFSPDGHRLASSSRDGTIRIWDARPLNTVQPATSPATR